MDCSAVQSKLKLFFEDLLTEREYQEVCLHLQGCDACRQYAVSTGSLSYLLKELGEIEIPHDLSETIRFRVKKAAGQDAGKTPFWRSKCALAGGAAAVLLTAVLLLIREGREFPPAGQVIGSDGPAVLTTSVSRRRKPLSAEEAEYWYNQLQEVAETVTKITGNRKNKKEAAEDAVPEEAPAAEGLVPPKADLAPMPAAFHWHVLYSDGAERDEFLRATRVLEIKPDFADDHFLLFKATPKQLKMFFERVQSVLEVPNIPRSALQENGPDGLYEVSVCFLPKEGSPSGWQAAWQAAANKKKQLISLEEPGPEAEEALDWHIRSRPGQRQEWAQTILQEGGDIAYASDRTVIFSLPAGRVQGVIDGIRRAGGVFSYLRETDLDGVPESKMVQGIILYND